MNDKEQHKYIVEVLRIFDEADLHDELSWRVEDGYVTFFVICNDLFWWGTADAERITPEILPLLESTLKESEDTEWWEWASLVFVARARNMRPQGAYYESLPPEARVIFDSCGPRRRASLLNPKDQPV